MSICHGHIFGFFTFPFFHLPPHFAVPSSTCPGSYVFRIGPQGNGLRLVEVAARQTQDHVEQGAVRLLQTQGGLPSQHKSGGSFIYYNFFVLFCFSLDSKQL